MQLRDSKNNTMITLETTKNYFSDLRKSAPFNLMIPVVVSLIGLAIFIKKRI